MSYFTDKKIEAQEKKNCKFSQDSTVSTYWRKESNPGLITPFHCKHPGYCKQSLTDFVYSGNDIKTLGTKVRKWLVEYNRDKESEKLYVKFWPKH